MVNFPNFLRVVLTSRIQSIKVNGEMKTKVVFDGTMLKFAKLLAESLKFSYQLIPAGNIEIGRPLLNGSWTGLVGLLQRKETDVVISTLAVSAQRLEVADFSYPYDRVRLTFATRKPEYIPELLSFLLPFSLGVWILTILTILLVTAAFYVLSKKKYRFGKIVFSFYKTIVYQEMGIEPTSFREYILLTFWQIGAVFLIFCYAAVLLSFLTFPTLRGIRTISELAAAVDEERCQCICFPGSFLVHVLSKSSNPKDRLIGENLVLNEGSRDIEGVLSNRKSKKITAFLGGEDDLLPFALHHTVSEDEFIPALEAVAFQKEFCCIKQVDKVIGYVWASGIFHKLKKDRLFKESLRLIRQSSDISQESKKRPLSVEDLAGAFILLVLGWTLATVIFFIDIFIGFYLKIRSIREKKKSYYF